jgi:hypothetical protein
LNLWINRSDRARDLVNRILPHQLMRHTVRASLFIMG